MSMTKTDYELVASGLYSRMMVDFRHDSLTYKRLCWMLAHKFQEVNPKFDRNKFLTACGFTS